MSEAAKGLLALLPIRSQLSIRLLSKTKSMTAPTSRIEFLKAKIRDTRGQRRFQVCTAGWSVHDGHSPSNLGL